MALLGNEVSYERQKMTWTQKLLYQFPPRIAKSPEIPESVRGRHKEKFVLVTKLEKDETCSFTFNIAYDMTPNRLLELILQKRALKMNKRNDKPSDYILKIAGRDEYLCGDYPLVQFLYIQDTVSRDLVPTVVLQNIANVKVFEDNIYQDLNEDEIKNRDVKQTSTCTLRKKNKHISSWTIEDCFICIIKTVTGLNIDASRIVGVGVQVGLFHGGKSLCEPKTTENIGTNSSGNEIKFNQTLKFDINVSNVPRMARICLVIYEIAKHAKGGGAVRGRRIKDSKDLFQNPLAWVNTTVFDYKNQLRTGFIKLYSWAYAEDTSSDDFLHPLGTVEPNPRVESCASVQLFFHK